MAEIHAETAKTKLPVEEACQPPQQAHVPANFSGFGDFKANHEMFEQKHLLPKDRDVAPRNDSLAQTAVMNSLLINDQHRPGPDHLVRPQQGTNEPAAQDDVD